MKAGEKGYTILEILIASTIMVIASGAGGAAVFQVLKNTDRNNDRITAVRQAENAGYWITRDAHMAVSMTATGDLSLPYFLSISWTRWNDDGAPIYHSANYTLEDLTGVTSGVGNLKRVYGSSAGESRETLVAQYIYYDPDDGDDTSNTSYEDEVLTVKLTAIYDDAMESREYKVKSRLD